jgi:hypothetical protein
MTTDMIIDTLNVGNVEGEYIEVSLRGKPEAIIRALIDGLPREALLQLGEALTRELAKRRDEASGSTK